MDIGFYGDWMPQAELKFKPAVCLAVSNLECAFADNEGTSGKAYTCVLPTECMEYVGSGGFAALSVANNHVNDAGNFDAAIAALEKRFPAIQFFGTKGKPYAEFEEAVVIGCLEPCRSRGNRLFRQEDVAALIKELKNKQKKIYVYPHWGKEGEYTRYPAPWQQRLARRWIDAGADGVFGSHSHVPQGREYYKGKPIYYSLGNFDFDHPESKLYSGTSDRLIVEIDSETGRVEEKFNSEEAKVAVERASSVLQNWTIWRWAKVVGPFNLAKNTASWKIRLKKSFVRTLPKFLVWQILPQTLLFRFANCISRMSHS